MINLPENVDLNKLSGDKDSRTNYVGNLVFPVIEHKYGAQIAPSLTGILLDEDVVDFKKFLTDREYFNTKITEAHSFFQG